MPFLNFRTIFKIQIYLRINSKRTIENSLSLERIFSSTLLFEGALNLTISRGKIQKIARNSPKIARMRRIRDQNTSNSRKKTFRSILWKKRSQHLEELENKPLISTEEELNKIRSLKTFFKTFDSHHISTLNFAAFSNVMNELCSLEEGISTRKYVDLIANKKSWWKMLCDALDINLVLDEHSLSSVVKMLLNVCKGKLQTSLSVPINLFREEMDR